jgi:hypothetical protein
MDNNIQRLLMNWTRARNASHQAYNAFRIASDTLKHADKVEHDTRHALLAEIAAIKKSGEWDSDLQRTLYSKPIWFTAIDVLIDSI